MAKRTKSNTSGLAKALRQRIGRTVWFLHPDTGAVVRGTLRRGRKVEVLERMTIQQSDEPGGGRTYVMDERTYTLPRSVKINFGPTPIEVKK
jgi:hypothetical protein